MTGERGGNAGASPGARYGAEAVTVVIPTHDRRRLLLRALDSVVRQRDVRPEIVVVDDGSTDGTADAVRDLRLPRLRLVRHAESRGVSGARNAGLAQVHTPWVAFLDDDDLWAPDKLRRQLRSLEDRPDARWSCVCALHVDGDLRVGRVSPPPASGRVGDQLLRGPAVPGGGSGVLVDSAFAREVGGFDEELSILADWDFYLRLGLGSPVAAVDEPLLAYYVHSDSMYHDPEGLVRELSRMRRKYGGSDDAVPFAPDLAHWYVRVARMAHHLGDDRTALRLLGQGITEAGPVPVGRQVARRAGRQLARRAGRSARPRPTAAAHGPGPVDGWLAAYAEWAP
jgi:glycosyltransferase involved in cell wall biosynthesis